MVFGHLCAYLKRIKVYAAVIAMTILSYNSDVYAQADEYPVFSDEMKLELGISETTGHPIVVDFMARWCMPCQQFAPTYQTLARQYKDRIDMVSCDIDAHRWVASYYRVSAIPTVILFNADGEYLKRYVGIPDLTEFRADLESLLENDVTNIEEVQDNHPYYSIDGHIIENPTKGLYIHNGKKIIIR